jgi:hypothetical protein
LEVERALGRGARSKPVGSHVGGQAAHERHPWSRRRTVHPLVLDPAHGQSYPLAGTRCSATDAPPPSTAERHTSEVEVWQEVDWVGLRILKCGADGGAPGPGPVPA